MVVELGVSVIVPSSGSCTGASLSSTGSLGTVPPLLGYYEVLGLLAGPPASLRFLRSAVPPCALFFAPDRVERYSVRPGLGLRGALPGLRWRRRGLPGSWGTSCAHALLSDPGGLVAPSHSARRFCLPLLRRRRLPPRILFGAPSHGLRTRCLRFAARVAPGPRKTRFRLVASLCRAGLFPR